MTADVDVAVVPGRVAARPLLSLLEQAGIQLRHPLSDAFLREARLLPLVHVRTALPIDVVLVGRGLQQEFVARRRRVDVGGVRVPMISPEDLVATKVLAGRRKDIEDIRGVLLEQEGFDLARVRDVLGRLERALGDRRLLRRFERLVPRERGGR